LEKGWRTYDLLVGAGAVPAASGPASSDWHESGPAVGLLDHQLVINGANYTTNRPGAPFGWRGAYLEQSVSSDPWGQRYAVNVGAMNTVGVDVVVLSAGPDGIVQSAFDVDGLPTGGDDVVSIVSSGGTGR
jgi:hypothetical protein